MGAGMDGCHAQGDVVKRQGAHGLRPTACGLHLTRLATLAMLALTSSTLIAAQTFRSSVDYVLVDVSVKQRGLPVTDLTARDFVVLDSGVEQTIEAAVRETMPVDVTFVVDWSGSVAGPVLASLTRAMDAVRGVLRPADGATVVTFNHAIVERGAIPPPGEITRVFGIPTGQTSLMDATTIALIRDPAAGRRRMAILFTDGVDTTSFADAKSLVDVARRTDTAVFVVTLGADSVRASVRAPHEALFSALADTTGGAFTILRANQDLSQSFVQAFEQFRTSYVLTYSYQGELRAGWHPVSVRIKRGGSLDVRARQGYFADAILAKGTP
jgi:Ca-activated chloride channel homolog